MAIKVDPRAAIAAIFDKVQLATFSHQQNAAKLERLHTAVSLCSITGVCARRLRGAEAACALLGEDGFLDVMCGMVARVLPLRLGDQGAKRVVAFVVVYVMRVCNHNEGASLVCDL